MLSLQKGRTTMYKRQRNRKLKNIFVVLAALLLFIGILLLAKQKDAWQWIEEQWRPIKNWIEEVVEDESSKVEESEESSKIEESSEIEEKETEETEYILEELEETEDEMESSGTNEMNSSTPIVESMPTVESESVVEPSDEEVDGNWGVEDWN